MNKLSTCHDPMIKDAIKIFNQNGYVIPFSWNAFPDGQVQIKINKQYFNNEGSDFLNVFASLYNSTVLDLFFQILNTFNIKFVKINYLYGARCDKDESGDYFVCNVAKMLTDNLKDWNDLGVATFEFTAPHCFELCYCGPLHTWARPQAIHTLHHSSSCRT
jgi:hypothetical protein